MDAGEEEAAEMREAEMEILTRLGWDLKGLIDSADTTELHQEHEGGENS